MLPIQLQNILQSLSSQEWVKTLTSNCKLYLVGGCVRDSFLGKPIKDIDIIAEGITLEEIKNTLQPFGRVGIHGESFSVLVFKPKKHKGEPYEIAIPRIDRKTGKKHTDFEVITDGIDINTDLKRRDFTINSIAVNIENKKLLDPFNGLRDLKLKILRATDKQAFVEDPLRIIRGIQFASRFGFEIEPQTLELMQKNSHLVKNISGERIFEELEKILNKKGDTNLALNLLHKTGVDKALFDKKMLTYESELEKLDPISFYYVLGLLGDVNPSKFIKTKLRGDNNTIKNVKTLDNIFKSLTTIDNDEDLKYMLFKAFNLAPEVMNSVILPGEVDEIIIQMSTKKIPMTWGDIEITGDDIQNVGGIKEGPEIGLFKEKILRDALMNRFQWNNREKSLAYLKKILF